MQEIRTGVFSSTGASFREGKGAAPNLQKKSDKNDKLEK